MKKSIVFVFSVVTITLLESCSKVPACDTPEEVTYEAQIKTVIEAKCFLCHAPEVYKTKASRVKIHDFESLKAMGASGQLVGSISHSEGYIAMPYRKKEKIDSCAIELIKYWVTTGMKEK